MAGIIALRGVDGLGGCGCAGTRGIGDDSSAASAVVTDPKMSALTMGIWIAAIGTVGYIFWGTLQPKRARRA